jgi:hypothetical protein
VNVSIGKKAENRRRRIEVRPGVTGRVLEEEETGTFSHRDEEMEAT